MFTYHTCTYNCLPENELLGSKHAEDISLTKVHFVRLYRTIILQCTMQKT